MVFHWPGPQAKIKPQKGEPDLETMTNPSKKAYFLRGGSKISELFWTAVPTDNQKTLESARTLLPGRFHKEETAKHAFTLNGEEG